MNFNNSSSAIKSSCSKHRVSTHYCTPTRRKPFTGICLLLRHLLGLKRWIILTLYRQFKKHALSCMLFPVWRDLLLLPALHYEQCYHTFHGRFARWRKWRACDVGEAKEGLENELWRTWSSAHYPTFPSLHLRYSSLPNPSVPLPTSQLILQSFRCFSYVTAHSPTLLSLLLRHRLFT